jgi:hypothetical protein
VPIEGYVSRIGFGRIGHELRATGLSSC